jgi:hypothetical protein
MRGKAQSKCPESEAEQHPKDRQRLKKSSHIVLPDRFKLAIFQGKSTEGTGRPTGSTAAYIHFSLSLTMENNRARTNENQGGSHFKVCHSGRNELGLFPRLRALPESHGQ